jgi:hypothetical protein
VTRLPAAIAIAGVMALATTLYVAGLSSITEPGTIALVDLGVPLWYA